MLALELADFWLSPGLWSRGTIQFTNGPQALLNGAIAAGATSLTIGAFPTGAQVFPAGLAAGDFFYFLLDLEIFKATAYGGVSNLTWTVVGGQDSTTASAHASGAVITGILNAAALAFLRDNGVGYSSILKNGGAGFTQRGILNFIEGSNVTLTIADNGAAARTDVTIAASGGGGGGSNVTVGTYALLPGSPNNGDVYKATDSEYEMIRSAGAWKHFCGGIPVTRPDISTFANHGGVPDVSDNTRGPFYFRYTAPNTSYNWSLYTKALPTGGTGYTITVGFRGFTLGTPAEQTYFSVILRLAATGQFWAWGGGDNVDGDSVIFFTNPTTYGGSNPRSVLATQWAYGRTRFIRIVDDGTNWVSYIGWGNCIDPSSTSNVNWFQQFAVTHNGSITPDECGFGMSLHNDSSRQQSMEVIHFSATSP